MKTMKCEKNQHPYCVQL